MIKEVIHASLSDSVLTLAQLMAAFRVSCIVITEEEAEESLRVIETLQRTVEQLEAEKAERLPGGTAELKQPEAKLHFI